MHIKCNNVTSVIYRDRRLLQLFENCLENKEVGISLIYKKMATTSDLKCYVR